MTGLPVDSFDFKEISGHSHAFFMKKARKPVVSAVPGPLHPHDAWSIVKLNATLLFFEGAFGRGVAFSLTKRCI